MRKKNEEPIPKTLLQGRPYTPAIKTDLGATFAKVREQIQRDVEERMRSEKRALLASRREAQTS